MRRGMVVTSVVMSLGLGGVLVIPASGQTRVVVPIIVRQPSRGVAAPARTSVQVTTRTSSPQPGVTQTQVTVRDTTGIRGYAGSVPTGLPPGATQVTVRDTTGIRGFLSPGSRAGVNPGGGLSAPRADGPAVVVPFPVTHRAAGGGDLRSVIITSEGPIDFPIVILAD